MCLCARSNLAILLLEVILNGFYGGFVLFLGLISNSYCFLFYLIRRFTYLHV